MTLEGPGFAVRRLRPTGPGSAAQWMAVNGPANWACVDEEILDSNDLVRTDPGDVGKLDLYTFTHPWPELLAKISLQAMARYSLAGANPTFRFALKKSWGIEYSPPFILTATLAPYEYTFEANMVGPFEAGFQNVNGEGRQRVDQFWCDIQRRIPRPIPPYPSRRW